MNAEQFELACGSFHKVVQVLLRRGCNYEDAIDDTAAAFTRAWECRDELRDESKVLAWITRIAINESCTRYRRNRRLAAMPAGFEPRIEPDVTMQNLDLQRVLNRVSAGHREIIQAVLEGKTASEIAAGHMSVNAAYKRLSRARAELRKALRH